MGSDLQTSSGYSLQMPPVYDPTIINKVFNQTAPTIQGANIAGNIMSGISTGIEMGKSISGLKNFGKGLDLQSKQMDVANNVADRQLQATDPSNSASPYNGPNATSLVQVPGMTNPATLGASQQKAAIAQQLQQAQIGLTQARTNRVNNPITKPVTVKQDVADQVINGIAPQQAQPINTQPADMGESPSDPDPTPPEAAVAPAQEAGFEGANGPEGQAGTASQPAPAPQVQSNGIGLPAAPAAAPAPPAAAAPAQTSGPNQRPQPVENNISLPARGNVLPFANPSVLDWYKQNVGTNAVGVTQNLQTGTYDVALKGGGVQAVHPGYIAQNPGHWHPDYTNQEMATGGLGAVPGNMAGPVSLPSAPSTQPDLVPRAALVNATPAAPAYNGTPSDPTATQAPLGRPAPASPLQAPDGSVPAPNVPAATEEIAKLAAATTVQAMAKLPAAPVAQGSPAPTPPPPKDAPPATVKALETVNAVAASTDGDKPLPYKRNGGTDDKAFVSAKTGGTYYIDSGDSRAYTVDAESPKDERRHYVGDPNPQGVLHHKVDADAIEAQDKLIGAKGVLPSSLSADGRFALLRSIQAEQVEKEKKPLPQTEHAAIEGTRELITKGQDLQKLYGGLSDDQKGKLRTWFGFSLNEARLHNPSFWMGKADPQVHEVLSRFQDMANSYGKTTSGQSVTASEAERLKLAMGDPQSTAFGDDVNRFIANQRSKYPQLIDQALANKYTVSKDNVDFANAIHTNVYGPPPAVNQANPGATPAPTGTPSQANVVNAPLVQSQADLDKLPSGAKYRDKEALAAGTTKTKP